MPGGNLQVRHRILDNGVFFFFSSYLHSQLLGVSPYPILFLGWSISCYAHLFASSDFKSGATERNYYTWWQTQVTSSNTQRLQGPCLHFNYNITNLYIYFTCIKTYLQTTRFGREFMFKQLKTKKHWNYDIYILKNEWFQPLLFYE